MDKQKASKCQEQNLIHVQSANGDKETVSTGVTQPWQFKLAKFANRIAGDERSKFV